MKLFIIGGGAAGFFAALSAKIHDPEASVEILEKSRKVLTKVRISGGRRCNVTHACFDPRQLVQNYPRGARELLGPFHRFQPQDTAAWFKARGVELKTEKDGRMFPVTDTSDTIIQCLLNEADRMGIGLRLGEGAVEVQAIDGQYRIITKKESLMADKLILATGSALNGWEIAKALGHGIVAPVPSLFTLNIPGFPLSDLAGIAVPRAKLKIQGTPLEETGPLLITHWGFSGPCALKLSAFGARLLAEKDYTAEISIDWAPQMNEEELKEVLLSQPRSRLGNISMPQLPKRLWKMQCSRLQMPLSTPLGSLGKKRTNALIRHLKDDRYLMKGKTTNKEEFVTCGGVKLQEVDFKSMESKVIKNLYFCGEVLDIDGITGGFNFQNAWTTGWIAGKAAVC